jgi:hypothetical protein
METQGVGSYDEARNRALFWAKSRTQIGSSRDFTHHQTLVIKITPLGDSWLGRGYRRRGPVYGLPGSSPLIEITFRLDSSMLSR